MVIEVGKLSGNSIISSNQLRSPDKAGMIQAYAGSSPPSGWMIADGSVLEKANYPELFANIGSTWDTFNHPDDGLPTVGGTQFAIPNLKGLYLGGVGSNGDSTFSLANFAVDLTAKNGLSNSSSSISGTAAGQTGGSHGHTTDISGFDQVLGRSGTANLGNGGALQAAASYASLTGGSHIHASSSVSGTAAAQSLSGDTETRPKTAPVTYIIKLYDDTVDASIYIEPASATQAGLVKKNKTQIKYLASDVTSDGTISGFSFSNLVVGNRYKVSLNVLFSLAANDNVQIQISHGGVVVPILAGNGGTNSCVTTGFISHEFTATATTVTFVAGSISAGSSIDGNGTITETWARLTEVDNTVDTTDFT